MLAMHQPLDHQCAPLRMQLRPIQIQRLEIRHHLWCEDFLLKFCTEFTILGCSVAPARSNVFTEMCSGSEAGSYVRLIYVVYHSTLRLRVMKKKKMQDLEGVTQGLDDRELAGDESGYEAGYGLCVGPYGRQCRRAVVSTRTRIRTRSPSRLP